MANTHRTTVRFTGSITYEAAPEDCYGKPWPHEGETHAQTVTSLITDTLRHSLMHEEDSLESTDYVQEIHEVTAAEAPELNGLAERAAGLMERADSDDDSDGAWAADVYALLRDVAELSN